MNEVATATASPHEGHEPHVHDVYGDRAIGFWLYLMTDTLIFALLFATYVVMHGNTAGGPSSKDIYDLQTAFAETMLLLTSTLTFGFASLGAEAGDTGRVLRWLGVTGVLGAGFLVLELNEFHGLIVEGSGPDRSGFLSSFFTLVGTHGTHVTFGMIWLITMGWRIMKGGLTELNKSQLYRLGLFWHFLDIVWIGIFSVVYLPGVM